MLSIKDRHTLSFLFNKYLVGRWKAVLFVVVANIVIGFLLSLRPLVLAPAIDTFSATRAEPANSLADLTLNNIGPTILNVLGLGYEDVMSIGVMIIVLFISITVLIATAGFLAQFFMVRIKAMIAHDMTRDIHRHILSLPLGFFTEHKIGDLVSRLTQDVNKTSNSIDIFARGILTSLGQVTVSAVVLFKTDVGLTATVIGIGSIHMLITRLLQNRMRSGSKELMESIGSVSAGLTETIIGIRVIKSFAAEKYESDKISKAVRMYKDVLIRFGMLKYYEVPLRMLADAVVVCVVLIIIFNEVLNQQLTPAGAAMFLYLSQQLSAPLGQLFSTYLGLHNILGGAARLIEIFETRNKVKDGERKISELGNSIQIRDVAFGYDSNQPVLKNISLEINKGEMVALVGPSGAGKSTFTDLLLRLYDVESGVIEYDGINIKDFRQGEYRRKFGVVAQECLLFNDSIRRNIILNRTENEDDLAHAIWAANLEQFAKELPDGLDTHVGDRGVRLSGGQRQRVALARAIYSHPSILILDEATSSLDSESERVVQEAIDRISKEITMIVVAHRLSTIVHADKIVLLKGGMIEAVGPHAEIIKSSPTYQKLYRLQFHGNGNNQIIG
ncbi:MAG: ABC transporter ATP-binding protein [Arenicellales bacterium]